MEWLSAIILSCAAAGCCMQAEKATLPPIPKFPEIPSKEPRGSVKMADSDSFQEVRLDIPITPGPFKPNWESIEQNYPGTPQWLKDAKFGIWVHFGPQSAGESGDWFYAPGFNYKSAALIRFIIEAVSRDGIAAVSIPIRPDGSVEEDAVKMLEEVGKWMDINGQADFPFDAQDLRFTLGKDGCLYVFTMAVPEDGRKLTVHTLKEGLEKIKDVSLLGFEAPLEWSRSPEGLVITCPRNLDNFNTSLVFRISLEK